MSNLAQSNRIIFLAAFLAGAAALFEQIVWTRVVERYVGVALPTVALISVVFLGGIALGGAIASFNSEKLKQPLKTFALSQALLAGCGLFFILFQAQLYAVLGNISTTDSSILSLFEGLRIVLIALVLLIPTTLMGLVFPLLAGAISKEYSSDSASVYLIGANSLGAVIGVLFCGLMALPSWGLNHSIAIAIACNLAAAIAASWLSNARQEGDVFAIKPVDPNEKDAWAGGINSVNFALSRKEAQTWVFVLGLLSMVFEMLWVRLLLLVVGSSIYAFSLILACQITGWALGAYLVATLSSNLLLKYENQFVVLQRLFAMIAVLLLAAGIWTACLVGSLSWQPFLYAQLLAKASQVFAGEPALSFFASRLLIVFAFVTPTAFALGTIFPSVLRAHALRDEKDVRGVSFLYVWNLLGAMIGCILAGLGLPLALSYFSDSAILQHSLILVCAGLFVVVIKFAKFLQPPFRKPSQIISICSIALLIIVKPVWNKEAMSIGAGLIFDSSPTAISQSSLLSASDPNVPQEKKEICLAYREGVNSIISILQSPSTNTLLLKSDGKMEAALPDNLSFPSPTSDLPTHNLLAEIPILLCPLDPHEALVIGFGSGATADTMLDYPGLQSLKSVDFAPDVYRLSGFFERNFRHPNDIQLKHGPRVGYFRRDGRNLLSLLKRHFDIIVCQPGEPYLNGMGDLYTREFWQLGRSRLRNFGVFAQWIQLYGMDNATLLTLCRTFQNVFPHTLIFRAPGAAEIIMVGFKLPSVTESEAEALDKIARSKTPVHSDLAVNVPDIMIDWGKFMKRFYECEVPRRLSRIGVHDPLDVITMLRFGQSDLAEFLEGKNRAAENALGLTAAESSDRRLNTDDHPFVEFHLPQLSKPPAQPPLKGLIHLFSAVPTRLDTFFFDIGATKRDTSDLYAELAMKYAEIGQFEPPGPLREEYLTSCAMLARRAYRLDSTDSGLPARGYVLQTFHSPIPKSLETLMYGFKPETATNEEDCLIIGRFFELRNLPERAGECFSRAVEIVPTSERALRYLANWQQAHSHFEELLLTTKQAIAVNRYADWAHALRGEAQLRTGYLFPGIRDLRDALKLNPELFRARLLLGKALCLAKREKEGLNEIYWASLVKPENPEPNLYVTAYYVSTGQWKQAQDNLVLLRRKLPKDHRVDYLAGKIADAKAIDKSEPQLTDLLDGF